MNDDGVWQCGAGWHTVCHHGDASLMGGGPGREDLTDAALVLERDVDAFRPAPDLRVINACVSDLSGPCQRHMIHQALRRMRLPLECRESESIPIKIESTEDVGWPK